MSSHCSISLFVLLLVFPSSLCSGLSVMDKFDGTVDKSKIWKRKMIMVLEEQNCWDVVEGIIGTCWNFALKHNDGFKNVDKKAIRLKFF
jgi:hypothetical protein